MTSSFPMKKNTATRIVFPILDNDGDPVSGAAGLDSEYSLDGGAFTDCTNEATEIGSSGIYYLDLTAAETNGDVVCIQVKTTTTDAKTTVLVFYTAAQTLDEVDSNVDAIKAKTDKLNFNSDATPLVLADVRDVNDAAVTDVDDFKADVSNLDVAVSTRSSHSAADVADAVWDEPIADHTTGTTFGGKNQKVVPSETIDDYKADVSNLDVAVSTRSSHSAADVWSVATRSLTDKDDFNLAADQSSVTIGTVNSVDDKTGYSLSASGIDAIVDEVIEGSLTLRQAVRLFLSALAGKSSGGGTTTINFRDLADTKNRITATVDSNGNRTAVTLDAT